MSSDNIGLHSCELNEVSINNDLKIFILMNEADSMPSLEDKKIVE